MDITLGRRPNRTVARPLDRLAFRARFDLRVEIEPVDGALTLTQIPIPVDETPLAHPGPGRRQPLPLGARRRRAGAAVEAYIRALNTQLKVPAGISSDDRFDIIVEHRRAATGETETGALLYAGLDPRQRPQPAADAMGERRPTQWFEASGVGRQTRRHDRSRCRAAVSSSFGLRMHPILGYSRMHRGLDFRASYGTPIVAVADGRVARAGWAGGYGNKVRLNHAGGLATSYSHMSRIAVAPGQRVRQGQVIGYVGSTGLSTGPHLHFEIYRNGVAVNPRSVPLRQPRRSFRGADLAAFRARLRSLLGTPVGADQREAQPSVRRGTTQRALIKRRRPKILPGTGIVAESRFAVLRWFGCCGAVGRVLAPGLARGSGVIRQV